MRTVSQPRMIILDSYALGEGQVLERWTSRMSTGTQRWWSRTGRACPDFAERIARFSAELPPGIVAGYWPIREEADPRQLMKALGGPLALPHIEGKTLSFRRWREGDALVDNQHGIAEPRAFHRLYDRLKRDPDHGPWVMIWPALATEAFLRQSAGRA